MPASAHFIRWIEGRAQGLRGQCALGPFARLDPLALAVKMGVPVFTPTEIAGLPPDVTSHVLTTGAGEWDAATVALPGGRHVVVMNPVPCIERQRASLMEELAHIALGHKPASLREVCGLVLRTWKQTDETQAYWVGAAALVPQRVMKGAVTRGMTVSDVAREHGVSQDLVAFREKVLGLQLIRPVAVPQ